MIAINFHCDQITIRATIRVCHRLSSVFTSTRRNDGLGKKETEENKGGHWKSQRK